MLNYVNRVIVGKSTGGANTGATLDAITRGDILVLSENMAVLSDGAAKQPIYVAVGTGIAANPFIMSSLIHPIDSMKVSNKTTRAAAEQVTFVGWNGTAGDIGTVVDGSVYEGILAFKDRLRLIANRQTRLVLNAAAEGTDKYDLCAQLENQSRFSSPHSDPFGVRVDILAVGTTTVSDNTVRVSQNSRSITYDTAATHDTGTAIIVGDVIAFDNIDYKITAVNALELMLDRPYKAASEAAFTAADIDIKKTITAAGLKITAVASPYNNADIDVYEKVAFEVGISTTFASAVVDYSVASDLGQGIYEQVKKMEFDVQGYLGNTNLVQWPIHSFDYHAVAGIAYDVVNITSQDRHEGDLQSQMNSPVGLTIAFSASASTQRAAVIAIIEDALGIAQLSW
jgi:hypothetical protein